MQLCEVYGPARLPVGWPVQPYSGNLEAAGLASPVAVCRLLVTNSQVVVPHNKCYAVHSDLTMLSNCSF